MSTPLSLVPSSPAAAPRFDLYGAIHKALRAMMADALLHAGRTDGRDPALREEALTKVEELLTFCRQHIAHEDEFIHAAIHARQTPEGGLQTERDHNGHHQALAELRHRVQTVRSASPEDGAAAAMAFYHALGLFVAENFEHMHHEETVNNALLWARYDDTELMALHDRLMQSIPPAEMAFALRWMLPSLAASERAAVLGDLRAKVPPGAFEGVLQMARDVLGAREWRLLCEDLGLAQGLAA